MNDLPEDPQVLNLLDGYLAQLQAGERPEREELLQARPDLASALDCLEALQELAAASAAEQADGAADTPDIKCGPGADTARDVPTPADDFPRMFGQYELLSEIGRGGMGVVYKARQETLDRTVAVKMILSSHLASPEHVRRFHSEARAAARLQHSNIVHIHEVGCLHGQHYFAMEYIAGQSLAQRLSRGPAAVPEAVRILAAVARAVDHLHRQNIVHRDLKPSNILLDDQQHPYVTDFGLAKVFEPGSQTTATGVIAGTPSYMAPEQASGHGQPVGPAADVYSLGAILYELLTGQPPFRQDSPLDTLMDVLSREPTLPRRLNPSVPAGLELICLKCLAKSPAERYVSAAALAEDLERFARGEALEVRPPHFGQRLWSWTRRQPALALRLGALAAFGIVEWINYLTGTPGVDFVFHLKMLGLLGLWAVASVVCQQFLDSRRWSLPARYVWGLFDSLLLLAMLLVADGAASPMIIGYPLLIVGSGLWFRVRFVWFMTGLSLVSYGVLVADFYLRRPWLSSVVDPSYHRHVIFTAGLVVMGSGVAYLVHRVRTLSSFYGRQLP
jgi:serine/threonine-protein kinase